jgi:hypothetical protein
MNRRAVIEESKLSLSPSAVGTPQADQSGQILAEGVQNFAKGLMVREDKVNTLAATARYGDFNAAYTRNKADLQLQYKDNPAGYDGAVKAMSGKLVAEHAKTLSVGVAQKFREIVFPMLDRDRDNTINWSIQQEKDNVLGSITKSYGDVELDAEAQISPQGLAQSLGYLEFVHNQSAHFLNTSVNLQLKTKTRAAAIDNSMQSRILDNPGLLFGDLDRGVYDNMLTPGEVKKYQAQAHDAQINRIPRAQYQAFKTASVALSEAVEGVQNGTLSVGEISRTIATYKLHAGEKYPDGSPVIPDELISGLESLRQASLRNIPLPKIERDMNAKVALAEFDTRWDAFQTDRTNRGSVKGAREETLLYAQLLNMYQNGTIPPDEFQKKKNIMDTKIVSRTGNKLAGMPLEEAFKKAAGTHPLFTFLNDDDLYTAGYTMITEQVNRDKSLSPEQKAKYKDQYFLTYLQEVAKYPADQINKMQNPMTVATHILHGKSGEPGLFKRMIVYAHPETKEPLIYGQVTTRHGQTKVFLGLDDKGLPRWGTPKNTLEGLENR